MEKRNVARLNHLRFILWSNQWTGIDFPAGFNV